MPFPALVVWGAAALAAGTGVVKTVKAVKDNNKASKYSEEANDIVSKASRKAQEARERARKSLEDLGQTKLNVIESTIKNFLENFRKIKNVNYTEIEDVSEFCGLKLAPNNIVELTEMSEVASSVLSGTVSGVVSGAVAAYGAYGAVGLFASAGTGTAISSLGGAAASNATLAWLGGGTLAAGGGGVAAGTMVLGGIVAAPALLILGCVLGSKASKNLDDALSNLAEAKRYKEQMKLLRKVCKGIANNADFLQKAITAVAEVCDRGIFKLQATIAQYGTQWNNIPEADKNGIAKLCASVQLLKTLLDKKLLTEDGSLSEESEPDRLKSEYPALSILS